MADYVWRYARERFLELAAQPDEMAYRVHVYGTYPTVDESMPPFVSSWNLAGGSETVESD